MRARALPGSQCWAGQGTAPLVSAPLQVLCPQGGLGGRGFVEDRFALSGSSARDMCPALGQDRPQHWSSSEQPGPFPTQLCPIPALCLAPCALCVPIAKAAPAWGKMLPSCPTNPALPCCVPPSHRWKGITSRAVSHPTGTLSLAEVAQPAPSPRPHSRLDPAPHQLMSRPGTPQSCHSPHSASSLFCQATGTLPWGPRKPQTQSCGRKLFPQTALRENDAPVPATIPAGLHVPGAAA